MVSEFTRRQLGVGLGCLALRCLFRLAYMRDGSPSTPSTNMTRYVPDEIWEQIFLSLKPTLDDADGADYSSLVAVCLTCRRFQRIAQPLLYHTVICPAEKDGTFEKLTRALVANPQLGENVRAYKADDARRCDESFSVSTLNMPPEFLEVCEEYQWDRWFFTNATFCLASMPNLGFLDFEFYGMAPMLPWMLSGRLDVEFDHEELLLRRKHNADVMATNDKIFTHFGFRNLKELRLDCGGGQARAMAELEPIFLHPGLETLRLRGIDLVGFVASQMQWPEIASNIQVLDLDGCLFDGQGIECVLQRFPKLTGLTIRHADPLLDLASSNNHDDTWVIDLNKIGRLLRMYGESLVQLCVDTIDVEYSETVGSLGSLRGLLSLRHLDVSRDELTGDSFNTDPPKPGSLSLRDVLPMSLETVRFSLFPDSLLPPSVESRWEKLRNELYELLAGGEFPYLRDVILWAASVDLGVVKQKFEGWDSSVAELDFIAIEEDDCAPGCSIILSKSPSCI